MRHFSSGPPHFFVEAPHAACGTPPVFGEASRCECQAPNGFGGMPHFSGGTPCFRCGARPAFGGTPRSTCGARCRFMRAPRVRCGTRCGAAGCVAGASSRGGRRGARCGPVVRLLQRAVPAHRMPADRARVGHRESRSACPWRPRQRRAGRAALPPRLLRRLRARPRRQQYRGGLSWRGKTQRAVGGDCVLAGSDGLPFIRLPAACSVPGPSSGRRAAPAARYPSARR